jgi:hypothetical protein
MDIDSGFYRVFLEIGYQLRIMISWRRLSVVRN